MRIAIYSGSFNPVHRGHIALARRVAEHAGGVDAVWLLVTPHNPLKTSTQADTSHRLAMARIACEPYPALSASAFEQQLEPPYYTYRTLQALREAYPEHEFSLLIGADNWLIFHRWRNAEQILHDHSLLVYPRPGCLLDPACLPPSVTYLADAPLSDISSTQVREALCAGHDANNMLPPGVYSYISTHHLYGR